MLGVAAVSTQRVRSLTLDPARPALALIARPLEDASRQLPLVGDPVPPPPSNLLAPRPTASGAQASSPWIPIYVSEAVVDLYGARPGQPFAPLGRALGLTGPEPTTLQGAGPDTAGGTAEGVAGGAVRDTGPRDIQGPFYVAGVWRDYARQSGSIVIDAAAYRALTGDNRVNDLLLWLAPGAQASQVQAALRALPQTGEGGRLLEFASAQDIRATSMRIFDRSFAVTYWLQAVAIGIGLFGVAASFSAQVLARRKEFGLLMHLGLTRSQVLRVVAGEGLAWTAIGAAAGLHPELLWRPFAADGATHLRASVGVLPGLEYTFVPVDLGVRWVWKPWRFFQPLLGAGLESQSFVVEDGGPFWRSSVYAEFGTGLSLTDDVGLSASVVPSFAPVGVPGPGLAGRITLTLDLDVLAELDELDERQPR